MNIEKLREAVAWVKEQDELSEDERIWNQEMWIKVANFSDEDNRVDLSDGACGTAMCVAGKIVWDAGYREYRTAFRGSRDVSYVVVDGIERAIPDLAREILGIDTWEGLALFSAANTAQRIEEEAKKLADKYGHRL